MNKSVNKVSMGVAQECATGGDVGGTGTRPMTTITLEEHL